jgi:ABC-type multidrug transport system fused ATPase/permease subunit
VIKNLNFTIKPGEKIALVGPTGSGKSSIIRLLCRLYEANQGEILVDGINIRDFKTSRTAETYWGSFSKMGLSLPVMSKVILL